ncbi:MAG: hypothetical protein EWV58_13835 [Microcystis aeruginosa Ma_MB_F_20061100_S19]|uniref:Uncharacterized protein n=1 Tax=Microcystis flos-aquae TF09 TaxID=2060473 RepID=A0A3E0L4K3_9CHRO|nr:MAG: hypothetical protein DWQ54_14145 [Microcystis flos-aquae TF09]TRU07360.1 MAG: hypothetical protein EWV59_18240 [Microcystis aeruginosa Ma_MB_F_20061100_S19D]TRU13689.1 MAG: hypothetical protein EWV58_13835 [Microcystis aeruginosa Ma_MB_F_20061100_S19]
MRNVNLNILKFLESINNFCLSLSNIELGDRSQESGVRSQEIIFIYSSHTPHPTPHTPLPQWPIKVGFIEIKLAKIRQD